MRHFRAVFILGRCLALATLVFCAGLTFSQKAGQHHDSIDRFIVNLNSSGFDSSEGSVIRVDPAQMCCQGNLPYGLYFNKLTPYVGVLVPRPNLPIDSPLPLIQLRPDEAVVLIGLTPPEAKYFGYQLYLAERTYPTGTDAFFNPHTLLFASLGDPVNLRTIHTNGPDPFNREVVFIYTPDKGTEARVHAALRNAGYPDAIINTVVIPSNLLKLGMDPRADDVLIILERMAVFTNENAGQDYLNAFGTSNPPVRAFRVTPRTSGVLQPFPTPPLRIRGTGYPGEMDLTKDLNKLREAILNEYSGYSATEYVTRPVAYDGYDFIQRASDAAADTRDALYLGAGKLKEFDLNDDLTLADDEFLIAYGPKHVLTGKATYSNINVYASEPELPLGSVFDNKFENSADPYIQGDNLFYVYKIKRDCGSEDFCLSLAAPPYQPCKPWCGIGHKDCPEFIFDQQTKLAVFWRNYLEPRTNIGPAFTEILYDRLIKFSQKPVD